MSVESPPQRRRTQEQRRTETRERLLDAAEQLFTEAGYHRVSVDAVALAAGYSKGAVYGRFANKDDLFLAVYERRVATQTDVLMRGGQGLSAPDFVAGMLDQYVEMVRRDRLWRAVVIEFAVHAIRDEELHRRFAAAHRAALGRVASVVGSRPDAPADVWEHVMAVQLIASGMSLETLIDEEQVPADLAGRVARRWVEASLRETEPAEEVERGL